MKPESAMDMQSRSEPTAFDAPRHIGAVTLVAADMARVAAFYRDGIGLDVLGQDKSETLLGAGGRTLLRLRHDPAANRPAPQAVGLFHTAFLVPTRRDLARWLRHAAEAGIRLEGASDHIVSEALYLSDPEGNGIEIYADRPRGQWRVENGQILMDTLRLDLQGLMATLAPDEAPWTGIAPDTGIGHLHLKVGDVRAAEDFYGTTLGFTPTYHRPGASWMGSGGYHHHLAGNTWASHGTLARREGTTGLAGFEIVIADGGNLATLAATAGIDPWGHDIRFVAGTARG
jgi:catechol 2,3-dioxygenase